MTSKELYTASADALATQRPNLLHGLLKDYVKSHCTHPRKIWCYDSHLGKKVLKELPCGQCYHCRETKTNEWVTRMYAHAEDFKNVYFITLTYRSLELSLPGAQKFLIDYLKSAVWHADDLNQLHRLCWSPCVLCKDHYQKFLMRLRKNTGISDLTYVLCGEYGSQYHRPHFHAILFTNSTITRADIKKAWSLQLSYNKTTKEVSLARNSSDTFNVPFGRIDFHSLRENGSFDTLHEFAVDGARLSAHRCFAYVCKYIGKKDANLSRVRLAYNNLFVGLRDITVMRKNAFYDPNMSQDADYQKYIFSKTKHYERSKTIYSSDSLDSELIVPDYFQFVKNFRAFVSPSRGTPIGSLFVARHIDQMAQGVFPVSSLQSKSIVTPTYFIRKAREYVYGLRKLSPRACFGLGNLPQLHAYLCDMVRGSVPFRLSVDISQSEELQSLLKSDKCFKDFFTNQRFIIWRGGLQDAWVTAYRFNRSTRLFQRVNIYSLEDWCNKYLRGLYADYDRWQKSLNDSEQKNAYFDAFLALLEQKTGDAAGSLEDARVAVEDEAEYFMKEKQKLRPKFE